MHKALTPTSDNPMHRFRSRYGLALEWVVMTLMVVLAVEVTLGIVFRASGYSLVWYDEVASVLLAWLTFYGSALASVKRAHIGCPEVVDQFPPGLKRLTAVLGQILVIAFFALLGWVGLSITPFLIGESLVSLTWVSMNFVQSVIPISSGLILIAELMYLIDLLKPQRGAGDQAGASLADGLH